MPGIMEEGPAQRRAAQAWQGEMMRDVATGEVRGGRLRGLLVVALAGCLLAPLIACVLLRSGSVVPREFSLRLGPLRIATTCYSRQEYCFPYEATNPPPSTLYLLVARPGEPWKESALLRVRIR